MYLCCLHLRCLLTLCLLVPHYFVVEFVLVSSLYSKKTWIFFWCYHPFLYWVIVTHSVSELEALKKERVLNERNHKGYFRCEIKHPKTYQMISNTYQKFITEERLRQLHHPWSTQSNEALNRSVSSLAPKDRTFSKTESLQTRVAVAAAIKNVGYERFWVIIFKRLHIPFDYNIRKFIRSLDVRKEKQRIRYL